MFQLFYVGLFLTLLATLQIASVTESRLVQAEARDRAIATNVAVYGNAVSQYAHDHPAFTGSVTTAAAGLDTWYSPRTGMSSYAMGGTAYIYLTGSQDAPAVLAGIAPTIRTSGIKAGANLIDATGRVVGTAPGAIPDGSVVAVF